MINLLDKIDPIVLWYVDDMYRLDVLIIHHPIGLQGKDELSIQGFSYIMIPHLYILHSFMIY